MWGYCKLRKLVVLHLEGRADQDTLVEDAHERHCEARRAVVEALDVQGILSVENGTQGIRLTGVPRPRGRAN